MSTPTHFRPLFHLPRYAAELEPDLTALNVRHVMSDALLTCKPETPARDVARIMTAHAIHAVPIESEYDDRPLQVVTAYELAQVASSAARLDDVRASDVAVEAVIANPDEPVPTAAARMLAGHASHLFVVDPDTGQLIGVVSVADIVARWSSPF